ATAHRVDAKDAGWPAHGALVDHALRDVSPPPAEETAALLAGLGVKARVLPVEVVGPGGTEAAARRARYAALRAARPTAESPVLLGHTLDDQAETVLLGLGRGSGARSLAGMATWNPPWLRPLLAVRRATTRSACAAQGLPVWDDPHNADPRFTRVRVRHEVLPLLEDVLAGGVAEALARTAVHLAEDNAALDEVAAEVRADAETRARAEAAVPASEGRAEARARAEAAVPVSEGRYPELDVAALRGHPPAVRRRVLRGWLLDAGVREVSDARLRAADDLVGRWHGQGALALPGGLELNRGRGRLVLRRTASAPGSSVVGSVAPTRPT
ncbi:MAG: tRNA lysidine(34) synthetase TilS, partial [Pseudonocardia sp.]